METISMELCYQTILQKPHDTSTYAKWLANDSCKVRDMEVVVAYMLKTQYQMHGNEFESHQFTQKLFLIQKIIEEHKKRTSHKRQRDHENHYEDDHTENVSKKMRS